MIGEMSHRMGNEIQMGSLLISGKVFPLYKGLNLIGRCRTATVILKNESVSQNQAIIAIVNESQHFLSDVYSSNGTHLNNNRLHPLAMYELQEDYVIDFANVSAIYKKIPVGQSSNATSSSAVGGQLQSTQNVNDSFYSAHTQVVDNTLVLTTSEAHHNECFDDGYDFNKIPSPPCITSISPMKVTISIHEMPTQLHNTSDMEVMDKEIEHAGTNSDIPINDLPTQIMPTDLVSNVSIQDIEGLTNVNKQLKNIMCMSQIQNETLHFDDTIIPETQETPEVIRKQCFNVSEDIIDQSALNDSGLGSTNIKMLQHTLNSPAVIDSTPCKIVNSINGTGEDSNLKNVESQDIGYRKKCRPLQTYSEGSSESECMLNSGGCLFTTTLTQEIGYKKKPVRQIDSDSDTETAGESSVQIVNKVSEIGDKSTSKCLVELDNVNVNKTTKKHDESSKIDSESETDIEIDDENHCEKKNNSGSDTDIDADCLIDKSINDDLVSNMLDDNKQDITVGNGDDNNCKKYNNTEPNNCSDDETYFIPATQCSDNDSNDFNFNQEKTSTYVSNDNPNNISDFDISQKLNELQQSNTHQSWTEESIHFGLTDVETLNNSENKSDECTTNKNLIFVNKNKSVDTSKGTSETVVNLYEVATQKLDDELRQDNVNGIQKIQNIGDNADDNSIFFQPTQVSIVENIEVNQKALKETDNIFDQDTEKVDYIHLNEMDESEHKDDVQTTQKVIVEQEGVYTTPEKRNIEKQLFTTSTPADSNDDNIVSLDTQKVETESNSSQHQFLKPLTSSNKKSRIAKTLLNNEDDIFLCPTQVLSNETDNEHNSTQNDDLFLQPTQRLSFANSNNGNPTQIDDIFLQPTQEIHVSSSNGVTLEWEKSKTSPTSSIRRKSLIINKNIFTGSSKTYIDSNNDNLEDKNAEEDIFLQPTQPLIIENGLLGNNKVETSTSRDSPKLNKIEENISDRECNNLEDVFLLPTQVIELVKDSSHVREENISNQQCSNTEDIFLQPTQVIEPVKDIPDVRPLYPLLDVEENNSNQQCGNTEDVFLLPTQVIEPLKDILHVRSSLSLLDNFPQEACKIDEEESQLEVTFDTQTIKLSSQVNTRPQNPLVNVLENSDEDNDETQVHDKRNNHEKPMDDELVDDGHDFQTDNIKRTLRKKFRSSKKLENIVMLNSEKKDKFKLSAAGTDNNVTIRDKKCPTQVKKDNRDFKSLKEDQSSYVVCKEDSVKLNSVKSLLAKSNVIVTISVLPNLENKQPPLAPTDSDAAITSNSNGSLIKSENQTRTTRSRQKNLNIDHAETINLQVLPKTDAKTNTITKKSKSKVTFTDESVQSSKSKKSKFEHSNETPKVTTTTKRGRKLILDQHGDILVEPTLDLNQCKPKDQKLSEVSVISISSTESNEEPIFSKKLRKRDGTKVDKKIIDSVTEKRKNLENGTIEMTPVKKRHIRQEATEKNASLQTTANSERQRRSQRAKVVFTMLDDPGLESIIRSLGGSVVDTVKSCTVLVTAALKRSQKLLSAVGEAKPICGPDWLHACKKAGSFLEPWDYILTDKEAEMKWNFTLKEALNRSNNRKLLENTSFLIVATTTVEVIKAAIESSGGKVLSRVPAKHTENIVVIAQPENRNKYIKFLQNKPPIKVVAPEAIFDGVLRQEVHWDKHLLS